MIERIISVVGLASLLLVCYGFTDFVIYMTRDNNASWITPKWLAYIVCFATVFVTLCVLVVFVGAIVRLCGAPLTGISK